MSNTRGPAVQAQGRHGGQQLSQQFSQQGGTMRSFFKEFICTCTYHHTREACVNGAIKAIISIKYHDLKKHRAFRLTSTPFARVTRYHGSEDDACRLTISFFNVIYEIRAGCRLRASHTSMPEQTGSMHELHLRDLSIVCQLSNADVVHIPAVH